MIRATHVDPSPDMPQEADVVVIGGGILGITTALFLAQRGLHVTVCDKGEVASEQSRLNWGWVKTIGRDICELPMAARSLDLWGQADQITGTDVGFRRTGLMEVFEKQSEVAHWRDWIEKARPHGGDGEVVTGDALSDLMPGCSRQYAGALYSPRDGVAEPALAVPAFAEAAKRAGVNIQTRCAVHGITLGADGPSEVQTENGSIRCKQVLIAAGIWTPQVCRLIGFSLPQLRIRGSVMRTAPVPDGPVVGAWAPGLAWRRDSQGRYVVSQGVATQDLTPDAFRYFREFLPMARKHLFQLKHRLGRPFADELRRMPRYGRSPSAFATVRSLNPAPDHSSLDAAYETLQTMFPAFRGVAIEQRWAGQIDATPDSLPYLGWAGPGVFVATGFSGKGFALGPGAGDAIAHVLAGEPAPFDLTPFRLTRFAEKSKK